MKSIRRIPSKRFAALPWLAAVAIVAAPAFLAPASAEETVAPPEPLATLISAGRVEFSFYDPKLAPRKYPGKTVFDWQVNHVHAVRYDVTRSGGKRLMVIRQRIEQIDYLVSHVIELPNRLDRDDRWTDDLVVHEFDHVIISNDPRIRKLIDHLYLSLPKLEREMRPTEAPDLKAVQKLVNDELHLRLHAVLELVRWNYRLLDKVSLHGTQPIPERAAFFERLYTKPNLDEAGFPYTGDVLELLKSEEYNQPK